MERTEIKSNQLENYSKEKKSKTIIENEKPSVMEKLKRFELENKLENNEKTLQKSISKKIEWKERWNE